MSIETAYIVALANVVAYVEGADAKRYVVYCASIVVREGIVFG